MSRKGKSARRPLLAALFARPSVLYVAACLAATFAGVWAVRAALLEDPSLGIRTVEREGTLLDSHPRSLESLGVRHGASILTVNLNKVAQALRARHPYADVRVDRILPQTLRIRLTSRVPVLQIRLGAASPTVLRVDERGHLCEPPTRRLRADVLTLLEVEKRGRLVDGGRRYVSPSLGEWLDLSRLLARHRAFGKFAVSSIEVSPEASYVLRFREGFEVRLRKPFGRALEKLDSLAWFRSEQDRAKLDYVDVRFDDLAVKWKAEPHGTA